MDGVMFTGQKNFIVIRMLSFTPYLQDSNLNDNVLQPYYMTFDLYRFPDAKERTDVLQKH